jgi:hypothetical protein
MENDPSCSRRSRPRRADLWLAQWAIVAPLTVLALKRAADHLKAPRALEKAQLISRRVEGRRNVFTLAPSRMRQAQRWIDRRL